MFNQINELSIKANYFPNQIKALHGNLVLGNIGLEFKPDWSMNGVQIPYDQIAKIQVQVIFKKWFRGFFVLTKNGQRIQFLTRDTKRVIHVLNRKMDHQLITVYRGSLSFKSMFRKPKGRAKK
ncbi:DUF956 family protein [Secundilactobacillus malefermentans]|uniref:GRAM domain-containing protein n=1 Tax=Secundilactobacillus malefermentans TaxID=176292 RepID=A0A4R5NMK5_9LACO|nr:DUF956 family protein [Secundilactobacillus malefermentans]KRM57416.1 hypothetical protein FD44_GL001122 [Secundilactobacillus malefermentans DSM 5705 = KCTC 3548]QEA31987.1 DUF956 family protein [Secundilactobacillus malefermentans]TDG76925.1 hypothetical protein C5L31_001516 [Secundilactobacillus malefermentans]